ncbi:MAG: SDR family oxidoreductase [Planctomycetota bacterium]|jgi:gluconate 5-dehydrogenase
MESGLFNLSGKTALITGGSRGIGLAVAKGLAQNGAEVAIIARDKGRLQAARQQIQGCSDKKVWTFSFDLENIKGIAGLFENIISETKEIDILVNCAGTTARAPAEDIDLEIWNQVMQVNLTAAFVISQAFCRHRKQVTKAGKIINIGSLMCHGARPTTAAYASSKGGLLMLTKSLAVEWAKYNINVNAIGPGFIATDLTAKLQADEDFNTWVLSRTPLERWGQPGDIVGAVVFLASSASDFVTGQIVYVDGGWLAAL